MIKQDKLQSMVLKLIAKKKYDEALKLVESERIYGKNHSIYYTLYGIINLYMNNIYEARLFLDKAININPYDVKALNALSYILLKEYNLDKAIKIYLKILTIEPNHPTAKKYLDNFKSDRKIKQFISIIDPVSYFKGKRVYLLKYQKISIFILIFLLTSILGFGFYKSISNTKTIIETIKKDKYITKYYSETEKIDKNILLNTTRKGIKELLILNKTFSSNFTLKEKIKNEHIYRYFYILTEAIEANTLSTALLNKFPDIFISPQNYVGVVIDTEGIVLNKKITNGLTFQTTNGDQIDIFENAKINIPLEKKIKIKARILVINKRIMLKIIELLN